LKLETVSINIKMKIRDSMFLRNVGKPLPDYMASQPSAEEDMLTEKG
jgi:hypothetical protein